MFRLHDRTRRRLCLTAFAALCLVPTVIVAGWCVAWQLAGHLRAETLRLGRELGLDVSLGRMRHPRPGSIVYEKLTLADPETGQIVFRCGRLEADWTETSDPQGRRKSVVVLTAWQPEIESAGFDRLCDLLRQRLQGHGGAEADLHWTSAELTLRTADGPQNLADVEGTIEDFPGRREASLAFRLADARAADRTKIRLVRNRQVAPPADSFELQSIGEVPCLLLAMGAGEFRGLGLASRFSGRLVAIETPAGWQGVMSGRVAGLDLGGLVNDRFPHRLSGTADLTIQRARFAAGRLEEAAGRLTAGPGTISHSLIEAACQRLGLRWAADPSLTSDLLPYEQLAIAFSIDAQGLRLQGCCPRAVPGTVLVHRGNPLLIQPAVQPQAVAELIRTLAPADELQVPVTRQTEWLARRLPIPHGN